MIKEFYGNEVIVKLAQGLRQLRECRNINTVQLDTDLKMNTHNRADRLMHTVTQIVDYYNRKFDEYLLTDIELKELVNMLEENNISMIAEAILTISLCNKAIKKTM